MRKSELALDKYWVTQSGYFRLVNTVALGMGILYTKLLLWHGFSEQSKDKNISMRELKNRTVDYWLNNTFSVDSGTPASDLSLILVDDSTRPPKRDQYNSDPLPAAIYVTSGNSVSTLTTSSN